MPTPTSAIYGTLKMPSRNTRDPRKPGLKYISMQ
jgi:hypothetical protein